MSFYVHKTWVALPAYEGFRSGDGERGDIKCISEGV